MDSMLVHKVNAGTVGCQNYDSISCEKEGSISRHSATSITVDEDRSYSSHRSVLDPSLSSMLSSSSSSLHHQMISPEGNSKPPIGGKSVKISSHRRRASAPEPPLGATNPKATITPETGAGTETTTETPKSLRRNNMKVSSDRHADGEQPPQIKTRSRRRRGSSVASSGSDNLTTPDTTSDENESLDQSDRMDHSDRMISPMPPKAPGSATTNTRRRRSFGAFFTSSDAEDNLEKTPNGSSRRRQNFLGSILSPAGIAKLSIQQGHDGENITSKGSFGNPPPSPASSVGKPSARRRFSLTRKPFYDTSDSEAEGSKKERKKKNKKDKKPKNKTGNTPVDECHQQQQQQQEKLDSSRRRHSLSGSSFGSNSEKPRPRRNSLSCGSAHSVNSVENNINVHEYIADLRTEKGLPTFSRNMLMDTIAKQVSRELAESKGTKCSPTNYYGNVGQGNSVADILETMTTHKGTARDNILSPYFKEFGLGMSKGKDGLVYMCQVFK